MILSLFWRIFGPQNRDIHLRIVTDDVDVVAIKSYIIQIQLWIFCEAAFLFLSIQVASLFVPMNIINILQTYLSQVGGNSFIFLLMYLPENFGKMNPSVGWFQTHQPVEPGEVLLCWSDQHGSGEVWKLRATSGPWRCASLTRVYSIYILYIIVQSCMYPGLTMDMQDVWICCIQINMIYIVHFFE